MLFCELCNDSGWSLMCTHNKGVVGVVEAKIGGYRFDIHED